MANATSSFLLWCFLAPLCWEPFKAILFSPLLSPGYQYFCTRLSERAGVQATKFTTLHIVSNYAVGKYNCKQLCRWQIQATQSVGNLFSLLTSGCCPWQPNLPNQLPKVLKVLLSYEPASHWLYHILLVQFTFNWCSVFFLPMSQWDVELMFNWLLCFCFPPLLPCATASHPCCNSAGHYKDFFPPHCLQQKEVNANYNLLLHIQPPSYF